MVLSSDQWNNMIVGVCSPWIDLTSLDNSLPLNNKDHHQQQLYNELAHASHLSLPTVLLPLPPLHTENCVNYARYLHKLTQEGAIHCWVPLPITLSLDDKYSPSLSITTVNSSNNNDNISICSNNKRTRSDDLSPSTDSPHHRTTTSSSPNNRNGSHHENSSWKIWNTLRCLIDSSLHVSVALIFTDIVPTDNMINHWFGEPIKCIIIPTSLFITVQDSMFINTRTVQFRNSQYETIFQKFYKFGIQFILQDSNQITIVDNHGMNDNTPYNSTTIMSSSIPPSSSPSSVTLPNHQDLRMYVDYLQKLSQACFPSKNNLSSYSSYNDYLQIPLQPLADHLSNTTYEVFEQDKPKYNYYRKAIEYGLVRFLNSSVYRDRKVRGDVVASSLSSSSPLILVMVVGAGRGPLVHCTIQAAIKLGCLDDLQIYAIEKNPHAISTLVHLCSTNSQWNEKVKVVDDDMRTWNPPNNDKADILISELLGSFSDNELSPECLDGAERLLHYPWGISIPFQYTSYLAPVMSEKLWNNVTLLNDKKYYESPFVVRMHNYTLLQPPQPVFTFTHPQWVQPNTTNGNTGVPSTPEVYTPSVPDNRRFTKLRFTFSTDALIHGLGGYFDTTLIPNVPSNVSTLPSSLSSSSEDTFHQAVKLSILPSSHTPQMESWFPIFFPLRNPITVQPNDYIDVSIWRCVEPVGSISKGGGISSLLGKRVWYEYAVQTSMNIVTHIHNSAGKYHSIGL